MLDVVCGVTGVPAEKKGCCVFGYSLAQLGLLGKKVWCWQLPGTQNDLDFDSVLNCHRLCQPCSWEDLQQEILIRVILEGF